MSKERGKEVKPKKIKLKKKDRFAEVKKAMVPTYICLLYTSDAADE